MLKYFFHAALNDSVIRGAPKHGPSRGCSSKPKAEWADSKNVISLHSFQIEKLNYLKCTSCQCLIDSSNIEKIILKIDDSKYNTIAIDEFGMDALTFNQAEL